MISFEMFRKFLLIARKGSLAKAADALYISRPALVQQVKAAEAKLGFAIFDRTVKGVTLTPAGKMFLDEGEPIIDHFEQLYRKCRGMYEQQQKIIIIGILSDIHSSMVTCICRKYKERFPDVNIISKQIPLQDYFPAFLSGIIDIVPDYMLNRAKNILGNPAIGMLPCAPCNLGICVSKSDPLANLEQVSIQNLRGRKLMMHVRGATQADDLLRSYLEAHEPSIEIIDFDYLSQELFFKAEVDNAVMLSVKEFSVFPPAFLYVPVDWDYTIERGLLYHKSCRPEVQDFIDMAKHEIAEKNL